MNAIRTLTVFALAVTSVGWADDPAPRPKSLRITPDPAARLRAKLDARVTYDFIEIPLEEAVEFFSDLADLPIVIDEVALKEEGVERDTPITAAGEKVVLGTALDRILEPLNLTWYVKGDAVRIRSTIAAEEFGEQARVAYDVRALLDLPRPTIDVLDATRSYPAVNRSGSPGHDAAEDELVDLVPRLTGEPERWSDQGGFGEVSIVDGQMIVRTHPRLQRDVDRLLVTLVDLAGREPTRSTVRPMDTPDRRRIREALEKPIDVDFVETPLREVVEFLGFVAKVPIRIDEIAFEEEGIPLDEPITFRHDEASLRSVLDHVLNPRNLLFEIRHDSLVVTSDIVDDAIGLSELAVFDVRDLYEPDHDDPFELVDALFRLVGEPESWADQGGASDAVLVLDGLLVVRQRGETIPEIERMLADLRAKRPQPRLTRERPDADDVVLLDYSVEDHEPDEIVALIETMVDPESWQDEKRAVIRKVGRQLFVRATYANHRRIHELLSKLRPKSDDGRARAGFGLSGC